MEIMDRSGMTPLDSASVLLLRDGAGGVEVFLHRRHGDSTVLGGACVFPGGKVDRDDAELADSLDTPPEALQQALGEPALTPGAAVAIYAAAIREVFEESGVLFAPVGAPAAQQAWALLREGHRFEEVIAMMGLALSASALVPWSRWITPVVGAVVRKRFDTRFFVAEVPAGQEPVHDEREAVESVWMSPRPALQRYLDGEIQFAPPQVMTLAHIARHGTVASVLAEARARLPYRVMPESFQVDDTLYHCYPGDERHTVRERAMPGPLRMVWRNHRFQPIEGGVDTLVG